MQDNSSKIILDLCGGTGAWSKPYRDAGYDVRVITLPEYDVTWSSMHDNKFYAGPLPNGALFYVCDIDHVYGILAAPPCTEFSLAKNGSPIPRNLRSGLEVVSACLNIIQTCQLNGALVFWAMENPRGLLRKFMGRPPFSFKQWEFGDLGVKPTDIWGYFNAPKKTHTEAPDGITKRYKSGKVNAFTWAAPKRPEYAYLNLDRAALRAITPAGFAQAFFKANR